MITLQENIYKQNELKKSLALVAAKSKSVFDNTLL